MWEWLAEVCGVRGHRPFLYKVRDLERPVTVAGRRTYPHVLRLELRCRRCGEELDAEHPESWERVVCLPAPPRGTPGGIPTPKQIQEAYERGRDATPRNVAADQLGGAGASPVDV